MRVLFTALLVVCLSDAAMAQGGGTTGSPPAATAGQAGASSTGGAGARDPRGQASRSSAPAEFGLATPARAHVELDQLPF